MDEGRYLEGELINGRKRLISSAYEKSLLGDDLFRHNNHGIGIKDTTDDFLSSALLDTEYSHHHIGDESQRLIIEELMDRRHEELGDLQLQYMLEDDRSLDSNGFNSHPDLVKFHRTIPRLGSSKLSSHRDTLLLSNSLPLQSSSSAQVLRLRRNFSELPYENHRVMMMASGGGNQLPMVPSSIDSLNYRNRMNNSLNLFRPTNNDIPDISSDPYLRSGRNSSGPMMMGRPSPRRPGSLPPPPAHSIRPNRGGGYLPQNFQQNLPSQPQLRGKQFSHPQDASYYAKGRMPPPPRPGPRLHRLFVALYDYDPTTMSPNPEACDEELPFREGQIIKIHGEKDPDGFYWGEAGGRQGFVPSNMISEVPPEDDRVAQELIHERGELPSGTERRSMGRDRWGDIYASAPVKYMIALYDYDPLELSPNVDSEVELSFLTGDIIKVFGDMDDDGFYMGELNGIRGLVPSNFLTEAPAEYSSGGPGGPRRVGGPGAPDSSWRPPQRPGTARQGPPPPRGQQLPQGRGGLGDANLPERNSSSVLKIGSDTQPPSRLSPRGRGGAEIKDNLSTSKPNSDSHHQTPPTDPNKPGPKRNIRGVPAVLPELLSPTAEPSINDSSILHGTSSEGDAGGVASSNTTNNNNSNAATVPNTNPITSKLPSVLTDASGSLMQKFSDFGSAIGVGGGGAAAAAAAGAEGGEAAAEGSILSKGKDMLFKRFGF